MRTLSDVGEFGLIERITRVAGGGGRGQIVLGIGDDAALVRPRSGEDLVVSTDALVENVHFRWRSVAPRTLGRRALVANLSDLAAMGARPLGFTTALCAPPSLPLARFDGLLAGLLAEAERHGCPLIGGNLARARETTISITVLGAVARGRALRRDALRAGDRLFVTGSLGRSALARARAQRSGRPDRSVARPRLSVGRALAALPDTRCACIDVSDGLAADLRHLLEASGVGARIDPARLPLPRGFVRSCASLGLDPIRLALTGGEDFELLVGLPRSLADARLRRLERRLAVSLTEIGNATRAPGLRGLEQSPGWRHF